MAAAGAPASRFRVRGLGFRVGDSLNLELRTRHPKPGTRHPGPVLVFCVARSLLLLCLGLLAACRPAGPDAEALLTDACRYLWSRQDADGGWHSATHGLLRGGQAWTPFVLQTLLDAPAGACPRSGADVERALAFLRRHVNADGVLGLADPDVMEYPNYATAYGLRVLAEHGAAADSALVARMAAYLAGQQFVEHRGFDATALAYGSWGFGEQGLPPGHTGHVDLSHTRRVLQALRAAGHADAATFRKAEVFLRLQQNHPADPRLAGAALFDGGFYASAVVPSVNKSAPLPGAPPGVPAYASYATATADGLLALLAAGVAPGDERVQAAARWLRDRSALDAPAGLSPDHPLRWDRVLFFYHLAARAEAYDALGIREMPGEALVSLLAGRRRTDGSFANPDGAPNKEDDPILATAFAVLALSPALR